MLELALEELSALAAIYCEPDACEVLAVSGEGARAPLPRAAGRSARRGLAALPERDPARRRRLRRGSSRCPAPAARSCPGRATPGPARPREEALRGRSRWGSAASGAVTDLIVCYYRQR